MRLSWNEIRVRAAQFAQDWKDAGYEKGETQSFYNEFFDIFDVKRRTVARYEEHVQRLDNSRGFIDLFWPGVLLVEQKSAGVNLAAARKQAGTYFDALPERDRPRYQLLCDFQTFELLDRDEREEVSFALADLPQHVEKFGFILGVQKRTFRDQDPVNIEASERVGQLHDALAMILSSSSSVSFSVCSPMIPASLSRATFSLTFWRTARKKMDRTSAAGWRNYSRYSTRQKTIARPLWTKTSTVFPTSMATCSAIPCAFHRLIPRCASV